MILLSDCSECCFNPQLSIIDRSAVPPQSSMPVRSAVAIPSSQWPF
jgi:hypothetical protein